MGTSYPTLTVEHGDKEKPYKDLVYSIALQAWADIEMFLRYIKRPPEKQNRNTRNDMERNYNESIRFFTVPYGKGTVEKDISYFDYLINMVGGDESMAPRMRSRCLRIDRELMKAKEAE